MLKRVSLWVGVAFFVVPGIVTLADSRRANSVPMALSTPTPNRKARPTATPTATASPTPAPTAEPDEPPNPTPTPSPTPTPN